MRFCKECGNMLYIKLSTKESDVESLIYYCRKCGNEEKDINEDNICVSRTIIKKTVIISIIIIINLDVVLVSE